MQTFGIELELICLCPESLMPPPISEDDRNAEMILATVANSLASHGVPVSDPSALTIQDTAPPYSRWRVDDEHLSLTDDEQRLLPPGYLVQPLELASRKFLHAHDDWRGEVLAVLAALRELEATGMKFLVNESTGFHVHVGYSDGHIVPLRTAKNVCLFATAFEAVLDTLHASTRIAIDWHARDRQHCYPLSFFATVRQHGEHLFERLEYIERAASLAELAAMSVVSTALLGNGEECTGHNSAVNFDNLFPDPDLGRPAETLTGTIEFRQHAGTLDAAAILAWIDTTTGIVRLCADGAASPRRMEDFLDLLAAAPEGCTPWATLAGDTLLALPADARAHYDARLAGTLPQPAPATTDAHAPLVPLLSANWARNTARSSRALVHKVVEEKFAQGVYGFDPGAVRPEFPGMLAGTLLQSQREACVELGVEAWSEADLSCMVRWCFEELGKMHRVAIDAARIGASVKWDEDEGELAV